MSQFIYGRLSNFKFIVKYVNVLLENYRNIRGKLCVKFVQPKIEWWKMLLPITLKFQWFTAKTETYLEMWLSKMFIESKYIKWGITF